MRRHSDETIVTTERRSTPVSAKHVGRIGALAVALGIGGALTALGGSPVAHADNEIRTPGPSVGISVGGLGINSGSATAKSNGFGSVAVAVGKNSSATATNGLINRAVVVGNGSSATATNGNNNRATTLGKGSVTRAGEGNGNSASALGNRNDIRVSRGNRNKAAVTGNDNKVTIDSGDRNVVAVDGSANTVYTGCVAADAGGGVGPCSTHRGSDNKVLINGDRDFVAVGGAESSSFPYIDGNNNVVLINDSDKQVIAIGGSDNFIPVPAPPF